MLPLRAARESENALPIVLHADGDPTSSNASLYSAWVNVPTLVSAAYRLDRMLFAGSISRIHQFRLIGSCRQEHPLDRREPGGQADREGRKDDVKADDEGELHARQQQRIEVQGMLRANALLAFELVRRAYLRQ